MVNTLRKRVVSSNEAEYNNYREYPQKSSEDILIKTQCKIKENGDNRFYNDLVTIAAEVEFEGKNAIVEVCNRVNKEMKKDKLRGYTIINNSNEVDMENYKEEREYLSLIGKHHDFICGYVVEEDVNCVWIIIKESVFEYNKFYFEKYNEFIEVKNLNFNIMIFDEEELEEVKEELENLKCSEEIRFNG